MKPDVDAGYLVFRLNNLDDTKRLARSLAKALTAHDILTLDGDLGAGKTSFTQALAGGLGLDAGRVSSPTFTLVQEYEPKWEEGARQGARGLALYHFDAYRLENADAFYDLGLDEYFLKPGVIVIEWADQIRQALPENYLALSIQAQDEEASAERDLSGADLLKTGQTWILAEDTRPRQVVARAVGHHGQAILDRWLRQSGYPKDLEVR